MQANDELADDPVVDELMRGLFRVFAQVKKTVNADTTDRAALIVLTQLRDDGPVRLSDLAATLMLDVSTVSRQVRSLEQRGLVTRTSDRVDGRAVRIEIAPSGRQVMAAAWTRRHRWLASALADWTAEERTTLAGTLNRFADALHAGPAPQRPTTEPSS